MNHIATEKHIHKQYIEFDQKAIKNEFEHLLDGQDIILTPFRGGVVLGIFLSHMKEIAVSAIFPKDAYYIYPGWNIDKVKNILITEDVVDTGETLREIHLRLKEFNYDVNITVAALAAKPEGIKVAEELGVDLHYLEYVSQESWAVFPWEDNSPQQEQ